MRLEIRLIHDRYITMTKAVQQKTTNKNRVGGWRLSITLSIKTRKTQIVKACRNITLSPFQAVKTFDDDDDDDDDDVKTFDNADVN